MDARVAFGLLLFLASAAPAARAGVIVVDPGGGKGGGALLQAAVDSAMSGDILLLRDGDYSDLSVEVLSKAIAIIADSSTELTLRGLGCWFVPTSGTLVLRGLNVAPPDFDPGNPVTLFGGLFVGSASAVWIEDCRVVGHLTDSDGPGGAPTRGSRAIVIGGLYRATVVRCVALGGRGADASAGPPAEMAGAGGDGLVAVLSSVSIFECSMTGGNGGDGAVMPTDLPHGGDGAHLECVLPVALMGCILQGGDEGEGNDASVMSGPGLLVYNQSVTLRDCSITAGAVHGDGTASPGIKFESGSSVGTYPAPSRGLVAPAVVREGEDFAVSFHGLVGDGAWAFLATQAGLKKSDAAQGHIALLDPLPSPVFAGAITDPAGTLEFLSTMPQLPAGLDGVMVFLQSVMTPPEGGWVLGSGSALAWIDDAL